MKMSSWPLIVAFTFLALAASAYAQTPREELQQMVTQLQKDPNDNALRERIILLAPTLKPAPTLPFEAERYEGRAQFAFKSATSITDYLDVAGEYEKAIAAAPWVPGYYADLCMIYEKSEQYAEARKNCQFFLASQPSAQEASDVRKRIAGLEFAMEKLNSASKAKAETRSGQIFKDCPDCPEMVTLPQLFAMGKYEVTQGEWYAVMGNNPSGFRNCGNACPVEKVNWNDVQAFIRKINTMTGKQYRLPTDAEWEYACHGGNQREYCGGNNLEAVGWYDGNSRNQTHPVGQKQANGFGLYDMSGNVFEWTSDCYSGDCAWPVIRGGSWSVAQEVARAANRGRSNATDRYKDLGFRLTRSLP